MSQPAICNKCKDAGFPNELIKFEQAGTKADGSKKWRVLNASDGSEHKHKQKEAPKAEAPRGDYAELVSAIRDLAQAIREKKA
jgi:hypothetical protein